MVENAIRHGVRICEEGIVRVITRQKDDYHEIVIQDNGCAFDTEKIDEDNATHIGIRNVLERKVCAAVRFPSTVWLEMALPSLSVFRFRRQRKRRILCESAAFKYEK